MLEQTVNLTIEEAYEKLKTVLTKNGGRVITEEAPKSISFKQGSLWGVTPKSAKKTSDLQLESTESGTRINCRSKLSSDWKSITLIGCVLALILALICGWMSMDLGAVLATSETSFWGWLITINGTPNSTVGKVFVDLLWGLTVFLSVVIALEAAIVVYASKRIDAFAMAVLSEIG